MNEVMETGPEAVYAELARARAEAERLRQRSNDLAAELTALTADARRLVILDESTALLAKYADDNYRLAELVEQRGWQILGLYKVVDEQAARIADLEASTSWRVTAPLRKLTGAARQLNA